MNPPPCLIDSRGQLQPAVIGLICGAAGYNRRTLTRTRWRALKANNPLHRWLCACRFAAITLGRYVYYVPELVADYSLGDWLELILHEQTHRQQQTRHGWLGFYVRYVIYYLRAGYRGNPFEAEAYSWSARQLLAWRGTSGLCVYDLLVNTDFDEGARIALLIRIGWLWRISHQSRSPAKAKR